ncbi:MAG: InlB B-repeat-containing protein [Eubacteriales bacterium]|nr:InlB B-repeat-containing protein [Eubacteriales bacterium]
MIQKHGVGQKEGFRQNDAVERCFLPFCVETSIIGKNEPNVEGRDEMFCKIQKLMKNKWVVNTLTTFLAVALIVTGVLCLRWDAVNADPPPQTAWPGKSDNYIMFRGYVQGQEYRFKVSATTSWDDKKDGNKTKSNFCSTPRSISMTGSWVEGYHPSNVIDMSLETPTMTTVHENPDDPNSRYSHIIIKVRYHIKVGHTDCENVGATKGDGTIGQFHPDTNYLPKHNSGQTDVFYTINLSNFGMIQNENGKRSNGSWYSLNFSVPKVTVKYHPGDHSESTGTSEASIDCGSEYTMAGCSFQRKKFYKFSHWTYDDGASGINPGEKLSICGNKDFTAHWTDYYWTMRYEPNGGTGKAIENTLDLDETPPISGLPKDWTYTGNPNASPPTSSRKFVGWSSNPASKDAEYDDKIKDVKTLFNSAGTVGHKQTLYAVWKPENYFILFDSNGGSGTMDKQKVERDKNVNLNENKFTKKGYQFAGWSTNQFTTSTEYQNQQSIRNIVDEYTESITFYAVWKRTGAGFIYRPLLDGEMFFNARSLVGGMGTKYSSYHVDSYYGRYDAVGNPGYFTLK